MVGYLIRRFFQGIALTLIAGLVIYTILVILMPGGPNWTYKAIVDLPPNNGIIDEPTRKTRVERLERTFKLDRPWPVNYMAWLFDTNEATLPTALNENFEVVPKPAVDFKLGDLRLRGAGALTGQFGDSERLYAGEPVSEVIGSRLGSTLTLVGSALLITLLFAIPIGVIAAAKQHSKLDHAVTFLSFAGLSIPPFWLGLLFILFLAVLPKQWHDQFGWDWLPYLPPGNISDVDGNWLNHLYHLVLPVTTLALIHVASMARYIRFSMLDVLKQDYIRTARAKGLGPMRVVLKHALRNALLPLITVVGVTLPGLASGSIIIETVFNYIGVGQLFFRALGACLAIDGTNSCPKETFGFPFDYPIALTMALLMVAVVALSNILADILYALADPRIDYSAERH